LCGGQLAPRGAIELNGLIVDPSHGRGPSAARADLPGHPITHRFPHHHDQRSWALARAPAHSSSRGPCQPGLPLPGAHEHLRHVRRRLRRAARQSPVRACGPEQRGIVGGGYVARSRISSSQGLGDVVQTSDTACSRPSGSVTRSSLECMSSAGACRTGPVQRTSLPGATVTCASSGQRSRRPVGCVRLHGGRPLEPGPAAEVGDGLSRVPLSGRPNNASTAGLT
jgi:hypothetical protein